MACTARSHQGCIASSWSVREPEAEGGNWRFACSARRMLAVAASKGGTASSANRKPATPPARADSAADIKRLQTAIEDGSVASLMAQAFSPVLRNDSLLDIRRAQKTAPMAAAQVATTIAPSPSWSRSTSKRTESAMRAASALSKPSAKAGCHP